MDTTLDRISTDFLKFWTETVEPVAAKCSPRDVWSFAYKVEHKQIEHGAAEADPLMEKMKAFTDFNGFWYVGHMINDISTRIAKGSGIRLNMLNSITQVAGVLAPDSTYWPNVWHNDFSTEEAQNLRELGGLMETLVKKL